MCELAEPIRPDDSCEVTRSACDDLDTIDRLICEGIEGSTPYLSCIEIDSSLQRIAQYLWDLRDLLLCKGVEIPNSRRLEFFGDLLTILLDLLPKCKYGVCTSLDTDNLSILEHDELSRDTRDGVDIRREERP